MNWADVPSVWQRCFELAWEAHLEGSNPIAAAVVDGDGEIVATGKSAVKATLTNVHSSNCEIAHAEVNALLALDNRIHTKTKAREYTLYATLEPCPLCFSALYMSDVKCLIYAAPDRFGGSTNLIGTTPYLSRKATEIEGPVPGLDAVSIFLNVYCDLLRGVDTPDVVHEAFAVDYPEVVQQARQLGADDELAIRREPAFERVYSSICDAIAG